jgi:sortase (surface protein transpeptidase)
MATVGMALITHFVKELPMSIFSCRPARWGNRHQTGTLWVALLGIILLLAACQSQPTSATPTPGTATPVSNNIPTGVVTKVRPYSSEQTTGPVRLQIPEIGLDVPVIAMGWRVDIIDGQRTTVWDVPLEEAGWHINSMGAGGMGNTILSGHQVEGAAVFAPLALGSVVVDQEILLTDGDGITFVYRITEVTDHIPLTGATPEEIAQAAAYFAPADSAKLTLVTGWPDFTTTHRIFAVAEFMGVLR